MKSMPTPRKYANHAERQAAYRRRQAEAAPVLTAGDPSSPGSKRRTPSPARWEALIRQARRLVEAAAEEMEEYYEQRSERWQESEPGEALLERLQSVQEAKSALEEVGA
jgi:hypothetical protein